MASLPDLPPASDDVAQVVASPGSPTRPLAGPEPLRAAHLHCRLEPCDSPWQENVPQVALAGDQAAPGADEENGTFFVPFTCVGPDPAWPWHSAQARPP